MDRGHIEQVAGEWLNAQTSDRRDQFWAEWEKAQAAARALPNLSPNAAFAGDPSVSWAAKHAELLKRDEVAKAFLGVDTSIRRVDLREVVALQPSVQTVTDPVPATDEELLEYCLPAPMTTPCEVNVSFSPPIGQVMFIGDVPYLNSINIDARDGKLSVSPATHVNFLQVVDFQGRAYLLNGYHRANSLLRAGKNVVPAWVVGNRPPILAGQGFFNLGYLTGLARPPLLQDYLGPASIPLDQRLKRHGLMMRFEVAPFNVPL
jgi:hypothetical protein